MLASNFVKLLKSDIPVIRGCEYLTGVVFEDLDKACDLRYAVLYNWPFSFGGFGWKYRERDIAEICRVSRLEEFTKVSRVRICRVACRVSHFDLVCLNGVATVWFAVLAMQVDGKTAQQCILEVRRRFDEIPGISTGIQKPQYGTCVEIVSKVVFSDDGQTKAPGSPQASHRWRSFSNLWIS